MLKPTGKLKKLNSCPPEPPIGFISRLVAALRVDNALSTIIVHRLLSGRPSFLPTPGFWALFPAAGEDDHDRAQDDHPYRWLTGHHPHSDEVDEQRCG